MPYKDPEKRKAHAVIYNANYYAANREERKATAVAYNAEHREEKQTYNAAYNLANREASKARDSARYDTHPEEEKARSAAWRKANPEKARASSAASRAAHPETHRIDQARRRARKKGLPATLTVEEWDAIKAAYQHRCAYCGKKHQRLTQDHVIPLSRGGGTVMDNIVPACQSCNSKKQANLPANPVKLVLI